MNKDRVIIVDGINLFMRHYIAHPAMSENGDQVGGTVGFFNNLTNLVARCRPEKVFIIWEGGGSKRKRDLYSDYKNGRRPQKLNRYYEDIPDTYENRNYQIKTLISLLTLVPVVQVYVDDVEADDTIGYLCKYKLKEKNKIIISSDHDFYQLIDKKTIIWSPTLKSFVGEKKVIDRFNIHPNNFCLAKCIVGDRSDNIPGIKGVGFKSLSKCFDGFLSESFYSIDELMKDAKELSTKSKRKIFNNVIASESLIKRNWRLVLLDTNNLSHFQIKKIDQDLENQALSWKNIEAHKLINQHGIRGIDLLICNQIFLQLKKAV